MTIQDQVFLAVTAWKENRGGLVPGMQSVINVIVNRAIRHQTSVYAQCVARLQFSSMTAAGDPELVLWPMDQDPQWLNALAMAASAAAGNLPDITNGSIDYYAPKGLAVSETSPVRYALPSGVQVPFPKGWNRAVLTFEAEIAGQLFFREAA